MTLAAATPELRIEQVDLQLASCPQVSDLGIVGLHCGCGPRLYAGWLNTDLASLRDKDGHSTTLNRLYRCADRWLFLQHDATRPFPLPNRALSYVFAEHFIEHLSREGAVTWLTEMRRLVKPGGLIRLSTPDLARYVDGYRDWPDGFLAQHGPRLRAMGNDVPGRRAWFLNQLFFCWGHRWIYDFEELSAVIVSAGFDPHAIARCGYREGQVMSVAKLDQPLRNDESMYVEVSVVG